MSDATAPRHAHVAHTLKTPSWWRTPSWWLGLALSAALAALSIGAAGMPAVQHSGLSALTLAIVLGIVAGNTFFPREAARTAVGVDFSKSTLLRLGIVLFGLRITFRDIAAVGWAGIIIDALMVVATFRVRIVPGSWMVGSSSLPRPVTITTPPLPIALNPAPITSAVITSTVRMAESASWPLVWSMIACCASSAFANAWVAPSSIAFSRLFSSGSTAMTFFAPA
jgi:hypothetical protein